MSKKKKKKNGTPKPVVEVQTAANGVVTDAEVENNEPSVIRDDNAAERADTVEPTCVQADEPAPDNATDTAGAEGDMKTDSLPEDPEPDEKNGQGTDPEHSAEPVFEERDAEQCADAKPEPHADDAAEKKAAEAPDNKEKQKRGRTGTLMVAIGLCVVLAVVGVLAALFANGGINLDIFKRDKGDSFVFIDAPADAVSSWTLFGYNYYFPVKENLIGAEEGSMFRTEMGEIYFFGQNDVPFTSWEEVDDAVFAAKIDTIGKAFRCTVTGHEMAESAIIKNESGNMELMKTTGTLYTTEHGNMSYAMCYYRTFPWFEGYEGEKIDAVRFMICVNWTDKQAASDLVDYVSRYMDPYRERPAEEGATAQVATPAPQTSSRATSTTLPDPKSIDEDSIEWGAPVLSEEAIEAQTNTPQTSEQTPISPAYEPVSPQIPSPSEPQNQTEPEYNSPSGQQNVPGAADETTEPQENSNPSPENGGDQHEESNPAPSNDTGSSGSPDANGV